MIQAPIVSASAASTEPLATSPGAAKAQPKGVSPRILAAALMCSTKPETSSPMSLEIRLGSCVTARTARKAMIAVVSRPRRDEEIPAAGGQGRRSAQQRQERRQGLPGYQPGESRDEADDGCQAAGNAEGAGG